MRILIAFCFLALAIAATDFKKCTDEKCSKESNACISHLSCLTVLSGCYTKCGSDDQCYLKCFDGKSDKYLLDLISCGDKNCKAGFTSERQATFQTGLQTAFQAQAPAQNDCTRQTVVTCIQQFIQFGQQCIPSSDFQTCTVEFLRQNPQCLCQVNIF